MTSIRRLCFPVALLLVGAATFALAQKEPAAAPFDEAMFSKHVVPILQQKCMSCHNPDKSKGSLDLSTREAMLEGGGKGEAIVPGAADKSLLIKLVKGGSPKMPRDAEPLTSTEIQALTRWIDGGAPWPKNVVLYDKKDVKSAPWWAFQPIVTPALPKVSDPSWCKSPIDHFVLAKMDEKGLKPSPPADRAAFIRRVTFDLTGLPPTPEEIDAFVNDPSSEAFEKLVDRLLASDAYGERWARIWLDLVHYADTHGFDKDKRRLFAWLYRDWVVRAFQRDLPYRRFIQFQIAGDILFPSDPEGVVASGFVVAGPWDFVGQVELREGTVDKEKTRTLDRDDMVSNALATFNSMTVHCARCHDHKFDPISTKDYYRLQAVFAGVERGDRPVMTAESIALRDRLTKERDAAARHHAELSRTAAKATSPALEKIDQEIRTLSDELAKLPTPPPGKASSSNGYHSSIEAKADVVKWVQVDLGAMMPIDIVRLIPARPTDFRDSPGFGFPVRFQVDISDDPTFKTSHTVVQHLSDDYANPGDSPVSFNGGGKSARYVRVTAHRLWLRQNDYIFALAEMQVLSAGVNVALGKSVASKDTIDAGRWGRAKLVDNFDSRKSLPPTDDPRQQRRLVVEAQLATLTAQRYNQAEMLLDEQTKSALAAASKTIVALDTQLAATKESAKVYAVRPIPPRPIHVLLRGDVERKGDLVEPGSLAIFPDLNHHFRDLPANAEGPRRAALARWIADDKNVLTWRSIVNRVWQSHFGRGIVDSPNDFGKNGSLPTHPELLEWLAADFRSHDSLKRLHRMIVLSAAYRQSSAPNPEYAKIDGDNRYLWRMNRLRLDAESLRDSTLFVAGKLDRTPFGPGYNLFRFKDDHSPTYDHLDTKHLDDPATNRRTIYRFVPRSVPNPFLETLDCADPNISVPVRNTTLTALQALALLNDPFMIRQAENFAKRLQTSANEPEQQIALGYRIALGRPPTPDETALLSAYVRRHGLANACRVILNSNEFLFVD